MLSGAENKSFSFVMSGEVKNAASFKINYKRNQGATDMPELRMFNIEYKIPVSISVTEKISDVILNNNMFQKLNVSFKEW